MNWKLADVPYWSYQGVNHSIKGNGGPECTNFLSMNRRVWETLLACAIGCFSLYWGLKRCTVPPVPKVFREDRGGKRLLLVLMCLVFGIEIGFKFSSRTMIYIMNPCHVITAIQIFLLAAPPTSKTATVLFRFQMHCLYGAVLAILFPVLNTRKRALELEVYWIQHFLILITPFYLLRTGISGVYTLEPLADMSWAALTLGVVFLYHFLPLQILGMLTEVNLNNMVCPAVSDPFYGQNYRIYAIFHQAALILFIGKIYSKISSLLLEAMGTFVWSGDKLVTTATSKDKQICVTCKAQLMQEESLSTNKSHIN